MIGAIWCSQWDSNRMSLLEQLGWPLRVPCKPLLVRARHASRNIEQSFATGIVAGPADQGANRLLRLPSRRTPVIEAMPAALGGCAHGDIVLGHVVLEQQGVHDFLLVDPLRIRALDAAEHRRVPAWSRDLFLPRHI
jgi:hypothetical protein